MMLALQNRSWRYCKLGNLLERLEKYRQRPVSLLAGNFVNELELIGEPFILVLDDYHLIQDKSVHDLLNQLLHHPPHSMHLG